MNYADKDNLSTPILKFFIDIFSYDVAFILFVIVVFLFYSFLVAGKFSFFSLKKDWKILSKKRKIKLIIFTFGGVLIAYWFYRWAILTLFNVPLPFENFLRSTNDKIISFFESINVIK